MKMTSILTACALSAAALVAQPSTAKGSLTMLSEGERVRAEFIDGDYLRMESGDPEQGYMLMRDGKLYSVANQGGMTMVIDIADAMRMMGDAMEVPQDDLNNEFEGFVSLEATGRTTTVDGIEGEYYLLTTKENDGTESTEEILMTDNQVVVDFNLAMLNMVEIMLDAMGEELPEGFAHMRANTVEKGLGVMQQDNNYELTDIDATVPADERFVLPAEPMKLPGMGG